MPFNGSGTFVRLHNWQQDAANNIDISAPEMDGEDNGFAAGLTLCVTRDGQGQMAADFLPSAAATYNLGSAAFPWKSSVIGPPASGPAITLNGVAGSDHVIINAASGSAADRSLDIVWPAHYNILNVYNDGHFAFGNSLGPTLSGTANGNIVIASPSSGPALAIGTTPQDSYRVTKTSNQNVNNSIALTPDTALALALPNGTYAIRVWINPLGVAGGGFRYGFSSTGTMSGLLFGGNGSNAGAANTQPMNNGGFGTSLTIGTISATNVDWDLITGQVTVTAPGTLTFEFAQAVATVGNTTNCSGSWMIAEKIL